MEPQKHLEDICEQAPTINKMQSEGLGMCWPLRFPLTILSSVEIKSFPHTSVVLQRNWSFSLSLQIGVIVAPTDLKVVCFLLLRLLLFLIYDEKLLGPQCNSRSGAEYEAE